MLNENIKTLRKQKGLSQEELSVKLNVVRQTVSKWEQGLSVPDAEMLIALSGALDTPVSVLLGEPVPEKADGEKSDVKELSEKLEIINLRLAREQERRRVRRRVFFIVFSAVLVLALVLLATLGNAYMEWDYRDPEQAVAGVAVHAFVWVFVRVAPFALIASVAGIIFTGKRR